MVQKARPCQCRCNVHWKRLSPEERIRWEAQFETVPEELTEEEKKEFMSAASVVTISSDAFFPFRDSIDHASKFDVSYIVSITW